jgi:hypothetical protein
LHTQSSSTTTISPLTLSLSETTMGAAAAMFEKFFS